MNRLSFLPTTAFIISALLTAGAAHATTPVADCAVLDTPGERYVLTADVAFPGGGACFEIVADDVELDLGGHTVEGPGSADGSQQGVLAIGQRAWVHNGSVSGFTGFLPFSNGILVDGSQGTRLSDLTLSENGLGLLSFFAPGLVVEDVTANRNWLGLLLCGADDTLVTESTMNENQASGLEVQCGASSGLRILSNQANDNTRGIALWNGATIGALIDGNIGARNVIGASLDNAVDATVSNNNFSGNMIAGIAAFYTHGSTFESNRLHANLEGEIDGAGIGLELQFACDNAVVNNVATDNQETGINIFQSEGNLVEGNRTSGSLNGIQIVNFLDPVCSGEGNLVTGNSSMRNHYGIRISDGEGHMISGNTSRKNDVDLAGDCIANVWADNNFQTGTSDCMD